MSKRSLLVSLCIGMALGYFGYVKPDSERKQLMADAQGPNVPEVVVLASADIDGIQTKTFYVKSTNKVCTIAPSVNVMQTPVACDEAKIGVHRKVLAIVGKDKL
jgi:hypothetical protein